MTAILYEHPLNERIRNYLKLEQLFQQAIACLSFDVKAAHTTYFNALFAIVDTLERNDIRGDLIKELEKLEQNMLHWSQMPEVNSSALQAELQQTVKLIAQLRSTNQQWYRLKENKLLASLKQRFAIQGGSSTFDLPQLQFWLHSPAKVVVNDMVGWLADLEQIKNSLDLILKYIRLRADFEIINTDSGFYQDNGEGVLLLRIKVPAKAKHFPTISGNRFRYSIRFMLPCEKEGRKYSKQPTSFELARC
jgi:cell division protein ZapD